MRQTELIQWKRRLKELFRQYKFMLLVLLAGLILLLLPPLGGEAETAEEAEEQPGQAGTELVEPAGLERRLAEALSQIQGAGETEVILTLKSGPQSILAQDSEFSVDERGTESTFSSLVLSRGSGMEEAVIIQQISPQYQGALVICSGGDDPEVRLRLVEAVSALTGLGADKISVCKGK